MSATVAAALKKIAVAVLTNKKLRRVVLGIILGIIIIIMMPMAAILSIFSGDIDIDTDRLQDIVMEEMSDEEKAKLQTVEDMMNAIESAIGIPPCTAEFCFSVALLRVILQGVRRGYQHLFFGKLSCDCCRVKSLRRKFKDVFYHLRSNRIDHQSLLIFGQSVVAVGNTAGAAFSVVHTG